MAEQQALLVPNEQQIKEDLNLKDTDVLEVRDPELEKRADEFVSKLLDPALEDDVKRRAVDEMGLKTQQDVAAISKMLDEPIKTIGEAGEVGGPVAKALLDLKDQVEELDPAKVDFSSGSGFLSSIARMIPFAGNRVSRYFAKYMTAEAVINAIIQSLERGRDQLKRDNVTMAQDKENMIKAMERLMKLIALGRMIDEKIQYKLDREIAADNERHKFIQEELLFPLRQRIVDLQQTLNVNQQGILTIELLIRNNRELIRGVNRALNVTVSALQIAVACALALNNQEITLKKIDALNDTTSSLIRNNAERLKTQGAEIHKRASETSLRMEDLELAFRDIKEAIEDISKFRQEALPKMAQNILKMDKLNKEAFEVVQKLDKGSKAQTKLLIDIDDSDIKI